MKVIEGLTAPEYRQWAVFQEKAKAAFLDATPFYAEDWLVGKDLDAYLRIDSKRR